MERQVEVKSKESETIQPDRSHLEPNEKELPIVDPKVPRIKRLAFGIVGIALILGLSVTGWFLYSNFEPERVRLRKQNSHKYLAVIGAGKRDGANIVILTLVKKWVTPIKA